MTPEDKLSRRAKQLFKREAFTEKAWNAPPGPSFASNPAIVTASKVGSAPQKETTVSNPNDALLARLRSLVAQEDGFLAEVFNELDASLSSGGPYPTEWRSKPAPRATQGVWCVPPPKDSEEGEDYPEPLV